MKVPLLSNESVDLVQRHYRVVAHVHRVGETPYGAHPVRGPAVLDDKRTTFHLR